MRFRDLPMPALLLCVSACSLQGTLHTPPTAANELRFAGAIEAINDGCLADGICSLTIDGRVVVWMVGWSRDTWGQVSVERAIGTPVEVWCRRTADGCELRGNADYYVRAAR